jgi:N-sulfoglucosamine sulfohydrolase
VTHKLHVLPNEKFPYDEFIQDWNGAAVARFIQNAKQTGRPWFLMYNIRWPHRPFRNSDQTEIGVDPQDVDPPDHLPDTPVVRRDWAEYLDAVEQADQFVGAGLRALDESGQANRTLVVFMGDHGPGFQRGKMAVTDFGLRVPLAVMGPGIPGGRTSDALVSEIDLMPTLLELLGLPRSKPTHGGSIAPLLRGASETTPRKYVIGEIHHGAGRRDGGMQERSVYDGRYRLIYREGIGKPRDFNGDLWQWDPWGNRTYDETVLRKDEFPQAHALLRQLHPQKLGGKPPRWELYDVKNDPFELHNLAGSPQHAATLSTLRDTLAEWATDTDDRFITLSRSGTRNNPDPRS